LPDVKIFSFALRNVLRNRHRSLVTVLAMAFAGIIMIVFAALMDGFLDATERHAVIMNTGDVQIHAPGYMNDPDLYTYVDNTYELLSLLEKNGFYASPRLYGFALAAAGKSSAGVKLRGISINRENTVTEISRHVMLGAWLESGDTRGVVIGKKLARTLGVKVGDEIVIVGQASDGSMANDLYRVKGILKTVGDEIDQAGFFMLDTAFRELMVFPKGVHEIAIMRSNRDTDLELAKQRIEEIAGDYEIKDWQDLQPVIARILDLADAQKVIMILITYVAVATVILNAVLMSVFERIHEFGVMKALGVGPWFLVRLIFTELFIMIFAASIVALACGWFIAYRLELNGIDLSSIATGASFGGVAIDPVWPAKVTPGALFLPVLFLILIGFLAAVYPAVKAAVIQPVRAIYYR